MNDRTSHLNRSPVMDRCGKLARTPPLGLWYGLARTFHWFSELLRLARPLWIAFYVSGTR